MGPGKIESMDLPMQYCRFTHPFKTCKTKNHAKHHIEDYRLIDESHSTLSSSEADNCNTISIISHVFENERNKEMIQLSSYLQQPISLPPSPTKFMSKFFDFKSCQMENTDVSWWIFETDNIIRELGITILTSVQHNRPTPSESASQVCKTPMMPSAAVTSNRRRSSF
jgi:hypothetical protein